MKSKLAITSFILGIISLIPSLLWIVPVKSTINSAISTMIFSNFLFFLVPIVGLILGAIAIFAIKKNKIEGMWFAIFGVVFSLLGILIIFLVISATIRGAMSFI